MMLLLAGGKEMRSAFSRTSLALAQFAGIIACSQLKLPLTFKMRMLQKMLSLQI